MLINNTNQNKNKVKYNILDDLVIITSHDQNIFINLLQSKSFVIKHFILNRDKLLYLIMPKHSNLFLSFISLAYIITTLDPTRQIQLYPNTQNSDSIYIFSFQLSNNIPSGSYILIALDWYSAPLKPYRCIMVNTTIDVACTNFNTPLFSLTITTAQLIEHNKYLTADKTVAVLLKNNLVKDIEYSLQLHLFNIVPNLRKISPSAEVYVVSKDGLVYQENINYGAAINRPPIDTVLTTSILNDLSHNNPGELSTFKSEFKITQPVQTDLSAFTLVLHYPFSFSLGSLPRAYASELSATSAIPLYAKPNIAQYRIISPNIFYVVFQQRFVADRRFILQITEINNPFFLAQSNISIYSMNYNSLTPLEGFEHGYPIQTVSYPLTVTLAIPFDQPQTGSRAFYKNIYQYAKIDVTIPKTVPTGYSIKIVLTGGTISPGTAYANFESLSIDPVYQYGTNYLVIKSVGTMLIGSKISTTIQFLKDSVTTFSFYVYIDTEAIITASNPPTSTPPTNYMYEGRADGTSITQSTFVKSFYDSVFTSSTPWRISHDFLSTTTFCVNIDSSGYATSTGAYLDIYLSPNFMVADSFSSTTDCTIGGGGALCVATKTPYSLQLTVTSTNAALNPFPASTVAVCVKNINPPRSTSNKFIYPCYFTLYKTNTFGANQYYDTHIITVLPKYNGLTALRMEQHNDRYNQGFNYPVFLRVESTTTTEMNFVIQQNQIRVIVLVSRYGFVGMGTILNQQAYPCTSNIDVKCTYLTGHPQIGSESLEKILQWDKIVITFPSGGQNTNKFHVIVPDSFATISSSSDRYYYHLVGVYNKFTKDYKYYYMKDAFRRTSWPTSLIPNAALNIEFGGRAGSYRTNVTVNIANSNRNTGDYSFLCISTSWSFYEKGISSINSLSLPPALTAPTLGSNQAAPVSVYMSSGMYLTLIPIKYITGSQATTFKIYLDNVHMPYEYDLPNYYIYFIDSGNTPNGNVMSVSNQFIMTSAGIFYQCPLKSLTISCLNNGLGVKNTICTIAFGTQNPLKADGAIRIVFSGMTIATNVCSFYLGNGTLVPSTCSSTADNKNLTVTLSGWEHYAAGNFTLTISGVGITATQISQSFSLYLYDKTGKYVIETGNRILTTTIAQQKVIEVYEILYSYNSPLSYNKMSIRFYLPRKIYSDEEFGFVMGKDLSDVNTQIKRLNIILTTSTGEKLSFLYQLISSQYKVMFTFDDPTKLKQDNYTLEIYGIRTPASHQNGNFNIIFQRKYDKVYTLTNSYSAPFPTLENYIISDMSLASYYNTEGYDQQIDITIKNRALPVNDKMLWIINFPSYYSQLIFNYEPYCLINNSPIPCSADPNTPYQLIIRNSPRIVPAGTSYKISIIGVATPRLIYMNNVFPNRYIFIGILANSSSSIYQQTNLIYPEQNVYTMISGIIAINNLEVSSINLTSFYNAYMIVNLKCNIDILANQYLYLEFPPEFDNFNNQPLNVIIKTSSSVLGTTNSPVLGRRLEIKMPSTIPLNTQIKLEMTNVPTPTKQVTSQMSKMIAFVTLSDKSKITAASATSGNSAPKLSFKKDLKYISFNHDQQISITAGTYSQSIDIMSSDASSFLTNVKVSLSSNGFTFEPSDVLLKLGSSKAQFRIGADKDLFPISYFYNATKQEEVQTYYKITTNNNIKITNSPVLITIPTSIDLPIGGCSRPTIIKLTNPPVVDVALTYNYDNINYNQNLFFPNPHTSKSSLSFTKDNDNNTLSFCTASNVTGTSIKVRLVLAGTNYNSYAFTPSDTITFNLIAPGSIQSPSVLIKMINQQKTFIDFNLTVNVEGLLYYQLFIGDSAADAMTVEQLQVYIKGQVSIVESNSQFMTTIYLNDRDKRVGLIPYLTGTYTLRFSNLIPQTTYVFCAHYENKLRVIGGPFCQTVSTQVWGDLRVLKLKFTKTLTDFQLNKVLCFFTKYLGTQTTYLLNIQGNSCNDNAVKNINFKYPSTIFTNQKKSTIMYLATNPTLTSDPSSTAFTNMFDANNVFTPATLAAALSGYGIDFMSGTYLKKVDARATSARSLAQNLVISFSKPVFDANSHKITVDNIIVTGQNGQYGNAYFLLVLYKQFITDPKTNDTSVKIRLNAPPSPWQMMNCKNWQNLTAEGCARVVFSGDLQKLQVTGVQQNSMYLLYYMAANEFPFRPVAAYSVAYQSIVTMNYGYIVLGQGLLALVGLLITFL